ncbi:MAG: SpoIIE family protein phosphatase [Anaerolineaceae bacterium]|nr:SpoIIE family protein phosphatase [Anaerolineaceae bacterium]
MELRIAVAKINNAFSAKSGDTVEIIERPNGGLSAVLADGQANGQNNKGISTMISHRVIGNISEGVRDGSAIRAVSSRIFAEHNGMVQADLTVISADMQSNTILISRNNPIPVFIVSEGQVDSLTTECEPIGLRPDSTPAIVELPIRAGLIVVAFSDGIFNAGHQSQQTFEISTTLESFLDEQEPTAQEIADFLLNQAVRMDNSRPADDMSVVVMAVSYQSPDQIRRMNVTMTV